MHKNVWQLASFTRMRREYLSLLTAFTVLTIPDSPHLHTEISFLFTFVEIRWEEDAGHKTPLVTIKWL